MADLIKNKENELTKGVLIYNLGESYRYSSSLQPFLEKKKMVTCIKGEKKKTYSIMSPFFF